MRRLQLSAVLLIGVIGVVRVASTFRVFNATIDEPAHIYCGFQWLHGLPYTSDPFHPPLARAFEALPAYLAGVPIPDEHLHYVDRGKQILYANDRYEKNLALARGGNLPFLILAIVAVAWWAWRRFGPANAILSTSFLISLPPILGHAGLATTDLAATASFVFALVVLDWFLDRPARTRGSLLGLAIGVGLLSKFSFLVFFPLAAIVVLAVRWNTRVAPIKPLPIVLIAVVAFLVTWAGYRFEVGTMVGCHPWGATIANDVLPSMRGPVTWFASHVPIPAPLYVLGTSAIKIMNRRGHWAFLLGDVRMLGWWYYFPVVFFFKTPLPFLLLAIAGIVAIVRQERKNLDIALIPIILMVAVLPSSINVGVRYILPIYAPLVIAAAHGAAVLWGKIETRLICATLVAWLLVGSVRAHPDYLAWFNEAAGAHPERIAVDSNLDWGQDYLRLSRLFRARHIARAFILRFGTLDLERHGIVAEPIRPWTPGPGWYVLSETPLALDDESRQGAYRWLNDYEYTRVGKSIRLYHVPE